MAGLIPKARDLQDDGEYLAASECWAQSSFETLVERDFVPWANGGQPFGDLLRAIGCAVQADEPDRGWYYQSFVVAHCGYVRTTDELYDGGLVSAAHEWVGDGFLLLGSELALDTYEMAYEQFERADEGSARRWGMETAYERSSVAILNLCAHRGRDDPSPDLTSFEYETRLPERLRVFEALVRDADEVRSG